MTAPRTDTNSPALHVADSHQEAADLPLFSIETDDCSGDYLELKARGVEFEGEPEARPYGTGVLLKDVYGNRIYLNQD